MNTRLATLALTLMVLAGCGGGSGDDPQATPPPPRTYTLDELTAALPTAEDVEGAVRIRSRCPEDKESCGEPEPGLASVNISLEGTSPELTEKQADLGLNAVYVEVVAHPDEATAKSEHAKSRTSWRKYEGHYNFPRKDLGKGSYTPSEEGRGTLGDAASGPFRGFEVDRASTAETMGKFFSSTVEVRHGNAVIEVDAFLAVGGRDLADAEKLADQVLADYLKRLK